MNRKKRRLLLQVLEKPEEAIDIIEDMLRGMEASKEYVKKDEWLRNIASVLFYIMEIIRTKPEDLDTRDIFLYLRVIDYIVAAIPEMLVSLKEMVVDRVSRIYVDSKSDPENVRLLKELEAIEIILELANGLRRHIRRILEGDQQGEA